MGGGLIASVPIVATSCSKTTGNADGTDWKGHTSGKLVCEFNNRALTAKIIDGKNYHAKNLVMPTQISKDGLKYTIVSIDGGKNNPVFGVQEPGNPDAAAVVNLSGTLTLPSELQTIAASAFEDCVQISGKLTLPSTLTSLGDHAFKYCRELTNVIVKSANLTLGNGVFNGCSKLISDNWGDKNKISRDDCGVYYLKDNDDNLYCLGNRAQVEPYANRALSKPTTTIQPKTVVLAVNCFQGSTFSTELNFSQATHVTTIPSIACREASFTTVNLGATINTIGDFAFQHCDLNSVDLSHVRKVDQKAFSGCLNLASITLGSQLTHLSEGVFAYLPNLESINLSNVVQIDNYAFSGCHKLFTTTSTTIDTSNITLGANMKNISATAFQDIVTTSSDYDSTTYTTISGLKNATGTAFNLPYKINGSYFIKAPGGKIYCLGKEVNLCTNSSASPINTGVLDLRGGVDVVAHSAYEHLEYTEGPLTIKLDNNISLIDTYAFSAVKKNVTSAQQNVIELHGFTKSNIKNANIKDYAFAGMSTTVGTIKSEDGRITNHDLSGLPDGWTSGTLS